jgi:hypothetical protein
MTSDETLEHIRFMRDATTHQDPAVATVFGVLVRMMESGYSIGSLASAALELEARAIERDAAGTSFDGVE